MTLLIDHCRDVIGLSLRGMHQGYHVGWTTDAAKAEAAKDAGARVLFLRTASGNRDADGWEISFLEGREYVAAQ